MREMDVGGGLLKCKVSVVTRKRARIGREHYWKTIKEEMPLDITPPSPPMVYIFYETFAPGATCLSAKA